MSERKKLEFISSVTIMNTPMKKQKFIVDEMIYPGLHILSGDPKIGKSWMMMDMCLSIAKGKKFLGRRTEQGHVVYMALEDTFVSLQSRMYELTDEPSDNLQYLLLSNSIGNGLEEDLQECKNLFPDLILVVIDTLQKVRETVDMKYGTDYKELSVLKSIADQLEIAIVLVHHNRKTHDSNPNNMISGTNGIAGCADGLLVFTRNGNQAKLNISGRGAPSLELNLSREKAKWKLLDDVPVYKPDLFPSAVHDFICEKKTVKGTASEICKLLKDKFPEQDFNNNWLYRDLLQHDDEIRSLGIDYGKTKRNGIRNIYISYNAEKDSSGGKSLCAESVVPTVPQCIENVQDTLVEVVSIDNSSGNNAVPDDSQSSGDFIQLMADRLHARLTSQGYNVPRFNSER